MRDDFPRSQPTRTRLRRWTLGALLVVFVPFCVGQAQGRGTGSAPSGGAPPSGSPRSEAVYQVVTPTYSVQLDLLPHGTLKYSARATWNQDENNPNGREECGDETLDTGRGEWSGGFHGSGNTTNITGIFDRNHAVGEMKVHQGGPDCATLKIEFSANCVYPGPGQCNLEKKLVAVPGGPYKVERGSRVTLNGSRSKGAITYRWTFQPGSGCPPGEGLAHDSTTGSRVSFVALCSLKIALTVRDTRGKTDTADTTLAVIKRSGLSWTTPVSAPLVTNRFLPGFAPDGSLHGINACSDGSSAPLVCPKDPSWSRYFGLTKLRDPRGPFDGWFYVRSPPSIAVDRVAFLNPYLEPDGPPVAPGEPNWYQYNLSRGVDVAQIRADTIAHETWGTGVPGSFTGHTLDLEWYMHADDYANDPRRFLEHQVGTSRARMDSAIDSCLTAIDKTADDYDEDPLVYPPSHPAPEGLVPYSAWFWSASLRWHWETRDLKSRGLSGPAVPKVGCAVR